MGMKFALLLAGSALVLAQPACAATLDDAIAAALSHSPTLAAARAREDAAKADIDAARAERMPQANIEGQIGIGNIDPRGFFGLQSDHVTPRSARASIELPLFSGGRTGAAVKRAQQGAESATGQTRVAALETRIGVVQSWSQVLASRDLIRRYEKLASTLDESIRQANLHFKAGDGTATEIAQAEARRAEAEAGLAAARGQLAGAEAALAALTGAPTSVDAGLPGLPGLPASEDQAVTLARAGNPQLGIAKSQAGAARAEAAGARAERLPTIGAYAEAATVNDQFFPGYRTNSGSVGLRAHWTLFSGGRIGARERGADARQRAAEADVDAARLAVEQQAITGFSDVAAARAVLAAAAARLAANEAALRGTTLEVQAGAKPQLALLDAERETIEASAAVVAARGRLLVAAYRLRAIAGMD